MGVFVCTNCYYSFIVQQVRVEFIDTLERTNAFLPLTEYTFLANKSCDFQTVKKVKIRRRRRTCADDGDTTREILRQIVCEEHSDECAICRKILSKGIPKGEIAAVGAGVHGCCPRCSVSNFSTRCCDSKGIYKIVKDMLSRRKLLYLICV